MAFCFSCSKFAVARQLQGCDPLAPFFPLSGAPVLARCTLRLARCFLSANFSCMLAIVATRKPALLRCVMSRSPAASCHTAAPLIFAYGSPELPRCSLRKRPTGPHIHLCEVIFFMGSYRCGTNCGPAGDRRGAIALRPVRTQTPSDVGTQRHTLEGNLVLLHPQDLV
jgi:hypothetical protein